MSSIYVDGDACPVKEEVARVAARHALQVYIVSNQGLRSNLGSHVRGVLVGSEFDAADNWIVENITADDIAITADIQLAARCLKKNARAINPTGKFFTEENIGAALAMRELSSYLREAGEIKGSNAPFSKQDRSSFLQALDLTIQKTAKK
jgi:uncharacterized protein YaiI (UPF0178 family)